MRVTVSPASAVAVFSIVALYVVPAAVLPAFKSCKCNTTLYSTTPADQSAVRLISFVTTASFASVKNPSIPVLVV